MFLLSIGDAYTEIEIPFVFAKELWSPYHTVSSWVQTLLGPLSFASGSRSRVGIGSPPRASPRETISYKIDKGSGNETYKILIPNSDFLSLKDLVIAGYN